MLHTFTRRELLQLGAVALVPGWIRPSTASTAQRPADWRQRIEQNMSGWMSQYTVPGVSLAAVEKGRPGWSRNYGVARAGTASAVGPGTVFEAASLGKPILAYLVLKLAEERIIDLDASIGSFFRVPDFRDNPAVDAITPRIVLSHGTGLSNWRPPREPDRLRFTPGTGFAYSGEAYVRLQRAVVQAAGQPFEELVSRRIFTPRRMGNSSFAWRPDFEKSAAEGHDASGRPQRTRLWGASSNAPGPGQESGADGPPIFAIPNAAASLYSTAHDYAAFLATVLAPPAADAGHLSAASLALMRKAERQVNSDIAWALGWGSSTIDGAQHLWHWGNNGVYQAFVTGSPATGNGLVVLTNGANGLRLCREVFTAYLGTEHPAFRWDQVLRQAPR